MKKNRRLIVLWLALFVAAGAAAAPAVERPRVLDAETFMEMESLSGPRISPDGRNILFSRTWIDRINDRSASNIWLVDTGGLRLRMLTSGPWRDTSPVWSPDGRRIAFLSDRDGTTQLYVMWLDTRETAQLTRLERPPSGMAWSPDGRMIAFTAFVPDDRVILPVKLPKKPENAKWAAPAVVIDRLSWRSDGRGPVPLGHSHVFVVDAVAGGTPRRITTGDYSHSGPEWSADGARLYFSGVRKPDAEYEFGDTEIYAADLKTLEITALTDRRGPDGNPRVSPDGGWIVYTGYDEKNFTSHLSSVYLMDALGGGKRLLAGDLPDSPSDLAWAGDGTGVYYLQPERGESNVYFISLSGSRKKISSGVHFLSGLSLAANGTAAVLKSVFHRPACLAVFDAAKPAAMRTLVDVNADVLDGLKLGEVEELLFKSPDGLDLQGWLVKPVGFDPAKKYPLLLWIHGGPWSMYSVAFNWAWQNFAALSYAVLYMNPRGSTGYGQEFVNGIQHSYPGRDYDDLMAGVDAALARGFVDPDNLFVCGGSGGGVLTAWIVGHTGRFRAAVSMRPVIDWMSFVGTTDGANWYKQFKSYPWEDPAEYAARSPLSLAGRVTTPTMIMTGEEDLRTPMGQSEEFYRALKIQKKETLLVRMPEEYHGWRRPSHQLLQQLYLLAWFEKYRIQPGKE